MFVSGEQFKATEMTDKKERVYNARTLFSGRVIGKDIGNKYVGVPDTYKDNHIIVRYGDERMEIPDWNAAEAYRVFEDKFNRNKNYTLGYFKYIGK